MNHPTAVDDISPCPFSRIPIDFSNGSNRSREMGGYARTLTSHVAGHDADSSSHNSQHFVNWLATQATLFRLSWKNSLLAYAQYPESAWVRKTAEWQTDGHSVLSQASDIWLWEPIIEKSCPRCGNSLSYHEKPTVDCTAHQSGSPEYWSSGVVGTQPVLYHDISQVDSPDEQELSNPHTLLPDASPAAIDSFVRTLIDEDRYKLTQLLPHEAGFDGFGQVTRDVMTFKPSIELVECDLERQTHRLIRFHLMAMICEESGTPSSRQREMAKWAAIGLTSYLSLDIDSIRLFPGRLGDSTEQVEAAFENINTRIESYRKRLRRVALRHQSQF